MSYSIDSNILLFSSNTSMLGIASFLKVIDPLV